MKDDKLELQVNQLIAVIMVSTVGIMLMLGVICLRLDKVTEILETQHNINKEVIK